LLGGGGRSELWRQILADVTGLAMEIPETADASFGAALVAGIGVGAFASPRDAVARCVRIRHRTRPDAGRHALYGELFGVYREATRVLAGLDRRLHEILHGADGAR
jgi:xylulokinase